MEASSIRRWSSLCIGITAIVYGGVALIVKADDIGLHLATNGYTGLGRAFGRGLVKAMPGFMQTLSIVGTAAMVWVGGGIILHGLAGLGWDAPEHWVQSAAHAVSTIAPIPGVLGWLTTAVLSGILGLVLGFILIPVAQYIIAPVLGMFRKERAGPRAPSGFNGTDNPVASPAKAGRSASRHSRRVEISGIPAFAGKAGESAGLVPAII